MKINPNYHYYKQTNNLVISSKLQYKQMGDSSTSSFISAFVLKPTSDSVAHAVYYTLSSFTHTTMIPRLRRVKATLWPVLCSSASRGPSRVQSGCRGAKARQEWDVGVPKVWA